MIAGQAAPYMHARLASVEMKAEVEVTHMTAEQRIELARREILEAFAERPALPSGNGTRDGKHEAACSIAVQAAPYMHPRLASIDAKIDVEISTQLNDAERREKARQMILEAFAERPALPNSTIIEHQPIATNTGEDQISSTDVLDEN